MIVLKATYMLMLFSFLRMLFVYIPANCQNSVICSDLTFISVNQQILLHKLPRLCHANVIASDIFFKSQCALVHFFITVIFSCVKPWNISQSGSIESFPGKCIKRLCSAFPCAGTACVLLVSWVFEDLTYAWSAVRLKNLAVETFYSPKSLLNKGVVQQDLLLLTSFSLLLLQLL